MNNYDLIIALINRAQTETALHIKEVEINPCWYSGHKNKAKRAITTARELLLEASKELEVSE